MPAQNKNVNKADINSSTPAGDIPLDVMGLFFFAYRDFVGDPDAILAKQGFGRAHHRVLFFVNLAPGMPVADLLDILKITKQSLARVLRQLIDDGYIEQETGTSDRRQRLLYTTDKGKELVARLTGLQAARVNAALQKLDDQQRHAVRQFLLAMVEGDDRSTLDRLNLTGWV